LIDGVACHLAGTVAESNDIVLDGVPDPQGEWEICVGVEPL